MTIHFDQIVDDLFRVVAGVIGNRRRNRLLSG